MAWLKIFTGTLAAAATTFGIARRAAKIRVDSSISKLIDDASIQARQRVANGASFFLRDAWRRFLIATLVKIAILALLFAMSFYNVLGSKTLIPAAFVFLICSIAYDIYSRRLLLRKIFILTRKHGLRPKKIIRMTVANQVFDEVLSEYNGQKANLVRTALIHLGGHKPDDLAKQVASAVSKTAGETAWRDIEPFIWTAAIRISVLMTAYSIFATYIVWQISGLS